MERSQASQNWPKDELKLRWRQPIGGGYAGISVVGDNVLVSELQGAIVERTACYSATTGQIRWFRADPAILYARLDHGNGPRATPTVHDGLVYTMGATGRVNCLELTTGKVRWTVDVVRQHGGRMRAWGYAASPVIFRDTVVVLPGGFPDWKKNASVVALDRKTGKKRWANLTDPSTYATPILFERGGGTQLVCWTPLGIRGLDASTGESLWNVLFEVGDGWSIVSPMRDHDTILIGGFSSPIRLDETGRIATPLWPQSESSKT